MKKLINSPDDVLAEALRGVDAADENVRVDHTHRVIFRAEPTRPGKVAVISGGGSGHEPLHGGFVGVGMLDAACAGQVFTSPTPDQILAATVPYARARAESIGATAKVGIAERTDRLLVALGATFVVGLGAPQWVLTVALGYVAIASFITVIQRVWTVYRQTQRTGEPA